MISSAILDSIKGMKKVGIMIKSKRQNDILLSLPTAKSEQSWMQHEKFRTFFHDIFEVSSNNYDIYNADSDIIS